MTNPFSLNAIQGQQEEEATPVEQNPFALPTIKARQNFELRATLRDAATKDPA